MADGVFRFGLAATMLFAVPAHADFSGPLSSGAFETTLNMGPISRALNDDATRIRAVPFERQNPSTIFASADFTYTPSKSRTRSNLQALANHLKTSDPASGEQMERLFASTDVINPVKGVMRRMGLDQNNVAHAYAIYWVIYWGLANNIHDAPSPQAMQAVARQAEQGFAGNAEFAAMDNAQKQRAAEELMALAAIMDATSEEAKSNPDLAAQSAKAALQGSRKSGLQLDKMTLTDDGFVPNGKKRSDASGAKSVSDEDGISNTQLVLIAAAGGAGLAGVFLFGKAMGKKG